MVHYHLLDTEPSGTVRFYIQDDTREASGQKDQISFQIMKSKTKKHSKESQTNCCGGSERENQRGSMVRIKNSFMKGHLSGPVG